MTIEQAKQLGPVAHTSAGWVLGGAREGVEIYRGIPYGANCEGERRFLSPVAAQAWEGVRDCRKNGPIAMQFGGSISGSEGLGLHFNGGRPEDFGVAEERQGENCLVLNVLTPACDGEKRPVLVYFHGGGFATGSGTLAIGAHRYVKENNQVLVSVNHRLNIFGYLYLDQLDSRYEGSGMAGLLDLVLALEWVRQNIASFGGDPENVTIMGESGGGMKVSSLLAMPRARKLFRRAVVESGSAPAFAVDPQRAAEIARRVLERLGVAEDHLEALSTLPAEKILEASRMETGRELGFEPVADGKNARYNPERSFLPDPESRTVPLLVGASQDELAIFMAPGQKDGRDVVQPENLREYLLQRGGLLPADGLSITEENVDRVIEAFRQGGKGCEDADHLAMFICSNCSLLGAGAAFQAAACARAGEPVYRYLVTYDFPHPGLPGKRYSWHTADLPLQLRVVLHSEEEEFSRVLAEMLASFVRDGVPTTKGKPWPRYTPEGRETMVLDEPCRVAREPQEALLQALGTTL